MDLTSVLLISFAVAFLVSVLDYFADLGIARAGIAAGLSAIATIPLGLDWYSGLALALASSFVAMFALQIVERLNYRPGRMR
jgi:hypothetical protein